MRPLPGFTELQAVCGYLASRRAMVVLDNCEHLLGACAEIAEPLLQACPGGRGSGDQPSAARRWRRDRLAGSAPVPALEGPGDGPADSDAVALFVERASNVSPGFAVTDENVESVDSLCRDLDGIPLAIELAAARLRMLTTEQISSGLSDRFGLLTGGPRTALERHQTLRALGRLEPRPALRRASRRCCGAWPCSRGVSRSRRRSPCARATGSRGPDPRSARLAGRPVAGDRRGARLGRALSAAGDRASVRHGEAGGGRRGGGGARPPP